MLVHAYYDEDPRVRREAESLVAGGRPVDVFVRACFRFLLDREPKESILREFDIDVIEGYFPGFEQAVGN